jgi:hypothetical protein
MRRMAVGEAPDPLPAREVIALNYGALLASCPEAEAALKAATPEPPVPAEDDLVLDKIEPEDAMDYLITKFLSHRMWPPLEEWVAPDVVMHRLQELFLAVRQAEGQIVLFVDHFHRLLGGEPDRYPIAGQTCSNPPWPAAKFNCQALVR